MKIVFPYTESTLDGLSAVSLHAAPKDEIHSVIRSVRVTKDGFAATNRHTLGVFDVEGEGDGTLLIPGEAAVWLSKQTRKILGAPAHEIVFEADKITIVNEGGDVVAVKPMVTVEGRFPLLEKLFTEPEAASTNFPKILNPALLELFVKGAKRVGENMVVTFAKQGSPAVEFSFGKFRGLIQPTVLRGRDA